MVPVLADAGPRDGAGGDYDDLMMAMLESLEHFLVYLESLVNQGLEVVGLGTLLTTLPTLFLPVLSFLSVMTDALRVLWSGALVLNLLSDGSPRASRHFLIFSECPLSESNYPLLSYIVWSMREFPEAVCTRETRRFLLGELQTRGVVSLKCLGQWRVHLRYTSLCSSYVPCEMDGSVSLFSPSETTCGD